MQNRNKVIDEWKGFAIFLVVAGHVIAQFFDSWADTLKYFPGALYWWKVIYSFHMPLMFFISGYLFLSNRFQTQSLIRIWVHKIHPLILPYIFMGGILFLAKGVTDSFWYLRTLFLFISVQIVFEYIRKYLKSSILCDMIWISTIILLTPFLNWFKYYHLVDSLFDIDHFANNWIYFSIGVIFRRYLLFDFANKVKYLYDFCLAISALYIIIHIGYGILFNHNVTIMFVLCIIVSSYHLFNSSTSHLYAVSTYMQYMGKHSLEIYVLSAFTLFKIPLIGDFIIDNCSKGLWDTRYLLTGLTIEFVFALIISVIVIILCSMACEALKSFPLIYKMFLGRTIE